MLASFIFMFVATLIAFTVLGLVRLFFFPNSSAIVKFFRECKAEAEKEEK